MVYERHRIVPYFYFMLLVLLTTGSTGTNSNVLPTFVHCQYHDNNGSHVAMHHVPRPPLRRTGINYQPRDCRTFKVDHSL